MLIEALCFFQNTRTVITTFITLILPKVKKHFYKKKAKSEVNKLLSKYGLKLKTSLDDKIIIG